MRLHPDAQAPRAATPATVLVVDDEKLLLMARRRVDDVAEPVAVSQVSELARAAAGAGGSTRGGRSEHLPDPRQRLEPADVTVRQTESVADTRKDGGCGG
jgi:hypothetical protein